MAKSYYAILGISSMATTDEVRAAYRRLAKVYHPDLYHGNSEHFRQVQEAYNVLGNAERRRQYEGRIHKAPVIRSSRPPGASEPEPLIPETRSMQAEAIAPIGGVQSFSPSTDARFDRMWSNFSSLLPPKFGRLRTLTMEVPVTPAQARRGGTINISVPAEARCPVCQGLGNIGVYECSRCAGEGSISGEMPIAIGFPPNIPDNYDVMIPLDPYGFRNHQVSLMFRIVSR
jgi:DnaJ-class molecular chaperone